MILPREKRLYGLMILGVCLCLPACGGGDEPSSEAVPPTMQESTESSPEEDSAGVGLTVPPACDDPIGDSTGGLDLTYAGLSVDPTHVRFVYDYEGTLPATGTLLFSTIGAS